MPLAACCRRKTSSKWRALENHPGWAQLDCAQLLAAAKINLNTGRCLKMNVGEHHTDGFFAAVFEKPALS